MNRFTKFTLAATVAAALAACGGGGDSTSSSTAPAPSTPSSAVVSGNGHTINEVPMVTAYAAPPYPVGSMEAGVFAHTNKLRSECGFGYVTSDPKLDQTADYHARYLTVQAGDLGSSPHLEANGANPWFRGAWSYDRAAVAGYKDSNRVGEGMSIYNGILPSMDATLPNSGLMNSPYHALDLLAPLLNLAVGAEWSTKMGKVNTHPAAQHGFEWGAIVNNYGTTSTSTGHPNVQALPGNDVLTWPCSQSSEAVFTTFFGESPNPLPNRDFAASQPVGSPFYMVSRLDANMTINSIHLYNAATGVEIPLMPVRYMRNEIHPGNNSDFMSNWYMDAAFVFPDVPLPAASTLRMDFTATVSGKTISKSVTYRTR